MSSTNIINCDFFQLISIVKIFSETNHFLQNLLHPNFHKTITQPQILPKKYIYTFPLLNIQGENHSFKEV